MVANPFPVYLILYKLLQIKQKKANQTTTTCVNNFGNQWKITTVKITTNVLKRVFCLDQRWRNWIVINGVGKGRKKLIKTTSLNINEVVIINLSMHLLAVRIGTPDIQCVDLIVHIVDSIQRTISGFALSNLASLVSGPVNYKNHWSSRVSVVPL